MNEIAIRVVESPAPDATPPSTPASTPRLPMSPWPGGSDPALTCVYLALGLAVCTSAFLFLFSMAGFAARAGSIADSLRGDRWTVRPLPALDLVSTNARAAGVTPGPGSESPQSPG